MTRDDVTSPQPVILGLLMPEPKHGYELYQEFSRELGHVWQLGLSKLYSQLKQLEDAGLISAQVEQQPNRPARKVYHLTSEGQTVFFDWLHQPTPYLRHLRVEFLARLYFFRRLPLPGLEQLVTEQKNICQNQINRFEQLLAVSDEPFRRCVLEFRRGQLKAVIHWLDRCLDIL